MMVLFLTALSTFSLSVILFTLSLTLSKKTKNWREKWSPFECGFNFFSSSRMPFSMRFFLIAIIFIIFDVEIVLIVPLMPTILKTSLVKWTFTSMILMFVLTLGIFLEWKENSLEWKN